MLSPRSSRELIFLAIGVRESIRGSHYRVSRSCVRGGNRWLEVHDGKLMDPVVSKSPSVREQRRAEMLLDEERNILLMATWAGGKQLEP
jgi:hypothetical protein